MPFCESMAIASSDERNVGVFGRRLLEGLVDFQLPKRARDQVVSSYHLFDVACEIINTNRKLVGRGT